MIRLASHVQREASFRREVLKIEADAPDVDADPPIWALSGNSVEMIASVILAMTWLG